MSFSLRTLVLATSVPLVSVLAGGCATERAKPTQELTKARSVIEQADKGNAQRYAAADLQRAHDELSSAERAANDRKNDDARRFAEKAEVDADLATARGNSGEAERAAQEIRQSIDTLRQESKRPTNNAGTNDSGADRM
jgi:hypothetical protein